MNDIYTYDTHYNTSNLTLLDKINICILTQSKCYDWRVDLLKSGSFAREKVEMDFVEILNKLGEKDHFTIIHRKGYNSWKDNDFFDNKWCLEVGFTTFESPAYYLWIYCKESFVDELVEKFKLEKK